MAIKLQLKENPETYVVLVAPTLTLGKDEANDMVLEDSNVSDFHAEIMRSGDTFFIEDLLSANGTYVNGERIAGKRPLQPWDVIRVGNVELELNDPSVSKQAQWHLDITMPDGSLVRQPLDRTVVIGRDSDCDIVMDHELISRRHVELTLGSNHVEIKDLNSVNGTVLNRRAVTQGIAYSGDEIRIDPYILVVVGPQLDRSATIERSDRTQMRDVEEVSVGASDGSETELFDQTYRVACLVGSPETSTERRYPLLRPEYTLGRDAQCDITLEDPSISKMHAKLRVQGGQWHIVDLKSRNGVLVNGLLIQQATLHEGDRISLGREELVFGFDERSATT